MAEKIIGRQKCTFCKGSGKQQRSGWKCAVCGGTGKMPIYEQPSHETPQNDTQSDPPSVK
jgi:hypothetical protein